MGTGFGPTTFGGAFTALKFTVPALAAKVYSVTVVDQYGATSTAVVFTLDATPVFTISTRTTAYVQLDTISLVSQSTSNPIVVLRITDPSGLIFYQEDVAVADWQSLGGYYQLPYSALTLTNMPLTADAPVGSWNFTCWNAAMTAIMDTNLFSVSAKPTMGTILDAIYDLNGNMSTAITTSEGVIIDSIEGLDAKLTTISNGIATITTTVGEVKTAVSNLNIGTLGTDVAAIKADVATIKTNLGTLTVDVSDLDAKVTAISGDVATVSTALGTLQGTVTSIQGTTATIETDVGTLQADVTDVQSKADVTPVWIAVVLSLVAAIAAVFAVITIRQKIAG
jgi:hypothetical protein